MARLLFFGGFSTWNAISFIIAFTFVAAGIAVYSYAGEAKRDGDGSGGDSFDFIRDGNRFRGGEGGGKYQRVQGISSDDYFGAESSMYITSHNPPEVEEANLVDERVTELVASSPSAARTSPEGGVN